MVRRYDIVMVTDTRLPGGTSASVAEEIRAQAAAGYRTALLQIDSPLVRRARPMSPRLRACLDRGEVTLLLGDEPIETDLVVVRHPTVARSIDPQSVPTIRASRRVLVVNQAPGIPGGPDETDDQGLRYVPAEVDAHLTDWLGGEVEWAPIGPLVRADLAAVAPDLEQRPDDWVNVIDVAAWRQPRTGALHRIPIIGRHSRDDPMKWPATREDVLQVYPWSDDLEVHVLGGEPRLRELFGDRFPSNWVVHPFGAMPPERFLAGIDIYVYYHHPALVEAFGRTIMEAMASGAPPVLPPHFSVLFEDAATYARPTEVRGEVERLHQDRAHYRDAAERAASFVEERFGHASHLRRVAEAAEPTGRPRHRATIERAGPVTEPEGTAAPPRRVLFVSSNGAGVGHLMRLMALARHAPADVEPIFLTFSQGAKVVDDAGYFVEYLASRSISGATAVAWHPMLRERVNELIERYDVRALVFDGTWPYQGLLDAATDQPGVALVWSRRAMWKPKVSNPVLDGETGRFDLVIEPGEFAAEDDRGATRKHRRDALRVGPVCYLDLEELLPPAVAREELQLDPDRPAALVNLGAGNINDVSSQLGMVVGRLAEETELQVCVTRSIIADQQAQLPDNVRTISVYPLARYLPAFDLAFAAAGYNSYHELLLAGVPTAFIPNTDTATDDQAARSRYAHRVGVGFDLPDPTAATVDEAVRKLLDPDVRRRMHERAVARRLPNGAATGMAAIVDLLDRGVSDRPGALSPVYELASPRPAGPAATSTRPSPAPLGMPTQTAVAPSDELAHRASTSPADGWEEARSVGEPAATPPPPEQPPGEADGDGEVGGSTADDAAASDAASVTPAVTTPDLVRSPARSWRTAVARRLGPVARLLRRDNALRRIASRAFYSLPAPARRRVRRMVRQLQPARPQAAQAEESALPVPPGNVLRDAADLKLTPIAVVLPRTADTDTITALVDHLAQLQAASRAFAPLIITMDIDFRPVRRYGYLFEYVPGPQRWARAATDGSWTEARQRRITSIVQAFGISRLITLPEPDDEGADEVRAMLTAGIAAATAHR